LLLDALDLRDTAAIGGPSESSPIPFYPAHLFGSLKAHARDIQAGNTGWRTAQSTDRLTTTGRLAATIAPPLAVASGKLSKADVLGHDEQFSITGMPW
jgi:hypothetical protein